MRIKVHTLKKVHSFFVCRRFFKELQVFHAVNLDLGSVLMQH